MRIHVGNAVSHWGYYYGDQIAISHSNEVTYAHLLKIASDIEFELKRHLNTSLVAIVSKKTMTILPCVIGAMRAKKIYSIINPDNQSCAISQLRKNFSNLIILTDEDMPDKCVNISTFLLRRQFKNYGYAKPPEMVDVDLTSDAVINFTSGTTGAQLGVLRTHYSLLSESLMWIIELGLGKKKSFFIGSPLWYTSGFVFTYATLLAGGRLIIPATFDSFEILDCFKYDRPEIAFINPGDIIKLTKAKLGRKVSLNTVITIGAPVPQKIKLQFMKKFSCRLIESWGNTEGLGTITDSLDIFKKPGSVGRPCFCDELRIRGKSKGQNGGTICGFSDSAFRGYVGGRLSDSKSAHKNIVKSSDHGYLSEDGYLYLRGRSVEKFTNSKGVNFYTHDIQEIIFGIKELGDCAVVLANEKVNVMVVTNAYKTCTKKIRSILGEFDIAARQIRICRAKNIPRNAIGKIERAAIEASLHL